MMGTTIMHETMPENLPALIQDRLRTLAHKCAEVPKKLKKALYEFDLLERQMADLERQVKGISKAAHQAFRQDQLGDDDDQLRAAELRRIVVGYEIRDGLESFMNALSVKRYQISLHQMHRAIPWVVKLS